MKDAVAQGPRASDASLIEAFMAQVVTLSIAEYYRND